jgi:hypothetical protein
MCLAECRLLVVSSALFGLFALCILLGGRLFLAFTIVVRRRILVVIVPSGCASLPLPAASPTPAPPPNPNMTIGRALVGPRLDILIADRLDDIITPHLQQLTTVLVGTIDLAPLAERHLDIVQSELEVTWNARIEIAVDSQSFILHRQASRLQAHTPVHYRVLGYRLGQL